MFSRVYCIMYFVSNAQAAHGRRAEYKLNDSAEYFFARLDAICAAEYCPSQQDIVQARRLDRKLGIIETSFLMEGNTFKMYDVSGQRSERKKWIHCFEDVRAVLFVADISCYDQKLFEDESQNCMVEALSFFEEIVKYVTISNLVSPFICTGMI